MSKKRSAEANKQTDKMSASDTADKKAPFEQAPDGPRLRMPPIIDHEPHRIWQLGKHWHWLVEWAQARDFSDALNAPSTDKMKKGARKLARGAAYQLALVGLLGGTLAVTGLALLETRHVSLPSFDLPQLPNLSDLPEAVSLVDRFGYGEIKGEGNNKSEIEGAVTPPSDAIYKDAYAPNNDALDIVSPDNAPLADDSAAFMKNRVQNPPQNPAIGDAPLDTQAAQNASPNTEATAQLEQKLAILSAQLQAERAAHKLTRDKAGQSNAASSKIASPKTVSISLGEGAVARRALMAEWLVRLENGLPYEDLLKDPSQSADKNLSLGDILSRREMAAFGLFAADGIPTAGQLKIRLAQLRDRQQMIMQDAPRPQAPGLIGWLVANSAGLVRVRQAPPLADTPLLRRLDAAINNADYAQATVDMRRMLTQWESASTQTIHNNDEKADITEAVHGLYGDIQTLAELSPLWRAVRADFIAGVRP